MIRIYFYNSSLYSLRPFEYIFAYGNNDENGDEFAIFEAALINSILNYFNEDNHTRCVRYHQRSKSVNESAKFPRDRIKDTQRIAVQLIVLLYSSRYPMENTIKLTACHKKKQISIQLAEHHAQHKEIVLESVAHQIHGSLFLECQGQKLIRVHEEKSIIDISRLPPHINEEKITDVLQDITVRLETNRSTDRQRLFDESGYFHCFRLTHEDKPHLKAFLAPAFPLNTHLGLQGQEASIKFVNFIVDTYSDNGLGVGVKDIRSELDKFLETECSVLLPIFNLIEKLHGQYFASREPPTKPLQYLEILAAAVHPLYYNRGLLNMVCHYAMSSLRGKTPVDMTTLLEPTGVFSLAAGLKIGGIKVSELMYKDFHFNGSRPFATVPKPHDRITLIALQIDTVAKPFALPTNGNTGSILEPNLIGFTLLKERNGTWNALKGMTTNEAKEKYIRLAREQLHDY